jgi:hypothetical protein
MPTFSDYYDAYCDADAMPTLSDYCDATLNYVTRKDNATVGDDTMLVDYRI